MKAITAFKADDGKVFEDQESCRKHESRASAIEALREAFGTSDSVSYQQITVDNLIEDLMTPVFGGKVYNALRWVHGNN